MHYIIDAQDKAGVISSGQQYAICEGHIYTPLVDLNPGPTAFSDQKTSPITGTNIKRKRSSSGDSPSSNEYTFPNLTSDDEAELEAQLITSTESMKKKFAALLWKTIESFKYQGISP